MSYYGYTDPNPSEIELRNRETSRKAAEEGIVLLKNENNSLPIKSKKVALYGVGARHTMNNGIGSGNLEARYDVKIEEGLMNNGYQITTKKWLDDYDDEEKETYKKYKEMVESKLVGMTSPFEIFETVTKHFYFYPSGRKINENDVKESETDTAIYVITRQAGEGNDRRLEKGDYYITDIEKANLDFLTKSYSNTILILNVGGIIDLGFLDEVKEINSIVHYTQGGEEGGNALANLLAGKVNFSGKLVDTFPLHYEDIPFGYEYSHLNGQVDREFYKEGIYVGYRYYDSFQKEVRYHFGFGLSYTKFNIEIENVKQNNQKIFVNVNVTNVGSVPGKETVQVYVSVPGQNKEFQRLVGFQKTDEIKPNDSQKVEIEFDFYDCASYSEKDVCWYLEKGIYIVRVGNSSRSTKIAANLNLESNFVILQCKNCCICTDEFEELVSTPIKQQEASENTNVLIIDSSSFQAQKVDYKQPRIKETAEEKMILDSLQPESQIELLVGSDLTKTGVKGSHEIIGAAGKTTTNLISNGITNISFSDGPAGLNIMSEVCYKSGTNQSTPTKVPEKYNWSSFAEFLKKNVCSSDGTLVYRYPTCWPCAILFAQTWNQSIVEKAGSGTADEMEKYGISVILGPGMNIHRNPLCGRTFEYFSEDPFVSGTIAAAFVNGVQNGRKTAACLKHFCCNNCEEDRQKSSSNISERALREIYLKGFQLAVSKSRPKTVMTSYNLLNHIYTANRKDLIDDILRCEWNFEGVVMTDWNSCGENQACTYRAILAGNDLIMPGNDSFVKQIRDAYENGKLTKDDIRICAARVLHLVLNGVNDARIKKQE